MFDFSSDLRKRLLDSGIYTLHTSIDGVSESHDTFRGRKGAFNRTLENVSKAVADGFYVFVRTTLTSHNVKQLPGILDAVTEAGASSFKVRPVIAEGRCSSDHCPSAEEIETAIRYLAERNRSQKNGIKVTYSPSCFEFLYGGRRDEISPCFYAKAYITHKGDIIPCAYYRLVLGNLATGTIQDAWNNARANALRAVALSDRCKQCSHLSRCHGGCRATAALSGLAPCEPDPLCPMADSTAETFQPGLVGRMELFGHWAEGVKVLSDNGDVIHLRTAMKKGDRNAAAIDGRTEPMLVETDGLRVCYIPDLNKTIDMSQVEAFRPVDVLVTEFGDALAGPAVHGPTHRNLDRIAPRVLVALNTPGSKSPHAVNELSKGREPRYFANHRARFDLTHLPMKNETWFFGMSPQP